MQPGSHPSRPTVRPRPLTVLVGIVALVISAVPFSATRLSAWTLDSSPLANHPRLSLGSGFSCAIDGNDTVKCWGENVAYQTGRTTPVNTSSPVTVPLPVTPVAVSAGGEEACALGSNGQVWCWGYNGDGQTGPLYPGSQSPTPQQVVLPAAATSIELGTVHTCAVLADNSVWCWGTNTDGQLGDGTTTDSHGVPVRVVSVTATAVALGYQHTCALTTSGGVLCWGDNNRGELGNGSTTPSLVPVAPTGLPTVTAIRAGSNSTCAIAGSSAYCWGYNADGNLGLGTSVDTLVPTKVSLDNVVDVAVSAGVGCFLVSSGSLWCSGTNSSGQLGALSTPNSLVPIQISGLSGPVVAIDTANGHVCAQQSDGRLYCWGWNKYGQIGTGSTINQVAFTDSWDDFAPTNISTIGSSTCAVRSGALYCWGDNLFGRLGTGNDTDLYGRAASTTATITGGSAVTQSAMNDYYSCARRADGTVWCWGRGNYGSLGYGSTTSSNIPVQVSGLTSAASVATGYYHACAVVSASSTVACWGRNTNGQLGDNTGANSNVPVTVVGVGGTGTLSNVSSITSGTQHSCALTTGNTVFCWGYGILGLLGDGSGSSSPTPVAVSGISTATSITGGSDHTCALKSNGTVWCWGQNTLGQLGDGSTSNRSTPVQALFSGPVDRIFSGAASTCARLVSGAIECTGQNGYGQLGTGNISNLSTPTAITIPAGHTVTALSISSTHSCATTSTSSGVRVLCTGDNVFGQLGPDPETIKTAPQPVIGLTAPATTTTSTTSTTVPTSVSTVPSLRVTCSSKSKGSMSCTARKPAGVSGKVSYRMVCSYSRTRRTATKSSSASRVTVSVTRLRSSKTNSCTVTATKSGTTKAQKTFRKKVL